MKWWKGCRMSRAHYPNFPSLHLCHAHSPTLPSLCLRHSSFSNPSVVSPTSQLILQPFFHFSYITGSSLLSPTKLVSRWYSHAHLQFSCLFYLIIVIIKLSTVLWVIYWNKMSFKLVIDLSCLYSLLFFKLCCMPKIRFLLAWPACFSSGNGASLAISGATWMVELGEILH